VYSTAHDDLAAVHSCVVGEWLKLLTDLWSQTCRNFVDGLLWTDCQSLVCNFTFYAFIYSTV